MQREQLQRSGFRWFRIFGTCWRRKYRTMANNQANKARNIDMMLRTGQNLHKTELTFQFRHSLNHVHGFEPSSANRIIKRYCKWYALIVHVPADEVNDHWNPEISGRRKTSNSRDVGWGFQGGLVRNDQIKEKVLGGETEQQVDVRCQPCWWIHSLSQYYVNPLFSQFLSRQKFVHSKRNGTEMQHWYTNVTV